MPGYGGGGYSGGGGGGYGGGASRGGYGGGGYGGGEGESPFAARIVAGLTPTSKPSRVWRRLPAGLRRRRRLSAAGAGRRVRRRRLRRRLLSTRSKSPQCVHSVSASYGLFFSVVFTSTFIMPFPFCSSFIENPLVYVWLDSVSALWCPCDHLRRASRLLSWFRSLRRSQRLACTSTTTMYHCARSIALARS